MFDRRLVAVAFAAASALAALLLAGEAAAQSFRPLPAVTTPIPLGDDNTVPVTLPFAVKAGAEAPYTAVTITQNAQIFQTGGGIGADALAISFDDFEARSDTGQGSYGDSVVNGRPAFIVTWTNVGYCCGAGPLRASVQIVMIDRSDIAPGDFDYEFNTQGLGRVSASPHNFRVDGVDVGRAGVGAFPADNQAWRATWTFRGGLLTSGAGPTLMSPPPVPTMGEWALILFGTILACGAALHVQRRRMVA